MRSEQVVARASRWGRRGIVQGIEVRESRIHGRGIFACEPLARGLLIGRYLGPRVRRNGRYVLWVWQDDDTLVGVSGQNDLRYVNHSRRPNAVFYGEELFALRRIRAGEEITVDYGPDPPGPVAAPRRRLARTA